MERKKRGKAVRVIIIIICLAAIAFALSRIVPTLMDYRESEENYKKLEQEYVQTGDIEESEPDWWVEDVDIELAELQDVNPDVIGWIRFDDTGDLDISYPILYSGDDDKYLRMDLYGNHLIAGSIFLAGASKPDFSDYHAIIYGHNMRNGSMFGSLKKYRNEEDFYEKNQYFTIYTKEKAYRYQIFSYHEVSAYSDLYQVGFGPDEVYEEYLAQLIEASDRDTGIRPTRDDRTITLSTCSPNGESVRTVVHAVRVDEKDYTVK